MMKLNPYMHFKNNARQAMDFYKSVFGGDLTISTFREAMNETGEGADNVMHSMLVIGPEMTIMASDTPPHMEYQPGFSVDMTLSGDVNDEASLKEIWTKLSEGANVTVPLDKAPWGDSFGMLTDKFGIQWMVNIAAKKE